jgi:hypothetical protein
MRVCLLERSAERRIEAAEAGVPAVGGNTMLSAVYGEDERRD